MNCNVCDHYHMTRWFLNQYLLLTSCQRLHKISIKLIIYGRRTLFIQQVHNRVKPCTKELNFVGGCSIVNNQCIFKK